MTKDKVAQKDVLEEEKEEPKPKSLCERLTDAREQRAAFLQQAEKQVAWFDGKISLLEDLCNQHPGPIGPPIED